MEFMNHLHYFPIIKGKSCELKALKKLDSSVLKHITPVIDIVRYDENSANKTIEHHLDDAINAISDNWDNSGPIILDSYDNKLSLRTTEGHHPIEYIADNIDNKTIRVIPTTGFDRDPDYNKAVSKLMKKHNQGLCIRLQIEDMQIPRLLQNQFDDLSAQVKFNPSECILIFDFRAPSSDPTEIKSLIRDTLASLPNLDEWSAIVFASTSMPDKLSDIISHNSFEIIDRSEAKIWDNLNKDNLISRCPSYGDYTIVNPGYIDIDFRIIQKHMCPYIRYTTDNSWLIYRGSSLSKHPRAYKQYYDLAKMLVKREEFMGESFSYGDEYILEKSKEIEGTGNPGKWVSIGVNHHITTIVDNLQRQSS